MTWPESPVLAGSLVVSYDTDGSPCVLKGPCDQYESPSWTCTAPSTARHLSHHTRDIAVTWPESAVLMRSLVANLDIEGPPCVLKGPRDQYESPSWTCTAPHTSHPFSHRTKRACNMARVGGPCGVARGQLRHREASLRLESTVRPQLSTVEDLHCATHCSPSLPSHQGHMFDMAGVGGPFGVTCGQL